MKMKIKLIIFSIVLLFCSFLFNYFSDIRKSFDRNVICLSYAVENEAGSEVTKCPDPYDVPDHFIEAKVESRELTCHTDGELTVNSKVVTGSYVRDNKYTVELEVKNCSGQQKGSCCKQSDVGVSFVE